MKKIITKFVCLVIAVITMTSLAIYSADMVTLYTENGKTQQFRPEQVEAQLAVGWYTEPVQRLYAEEKSQVFKQSQVAAQLTVGWYTEPVQRLYAEDKSQLFKKSQVAAQLTVGWYTEPVQRLYSSGKSQLFKESQVASQLSVGWYETQYEAETAYNSTPAESYETYYSTFSYNPEPDGYYYRTPYGKRYHLDPNCGGKNSYRTSNISGLSPYKKCAR